MTTQTTSKPGFLVAGIALCGILAGGVVRLAGFGRLAEILWALTAIVVLVSLALVISGDLQRLEGNESASIGDPGKAPGTADPKPPPSGLADPPLLPVRQRDDSQEVRFGARRAR